MKRQLNAISQGNPLRVKRVRLTQADAQTGSPRRRVRRQAQLSTARIVSPLKSQVETGARSASNRAALPQTNTQQPTVNREETSRVAETRRRRKPIDHPYTSLPVPKAEWLEQVSPETLLRKRPIDNDSDSEQDGEHRPKRTRLTRKNLALFNKMAKNKDASPPMSTAEPSTTTQTKTLSIRSSGFAEDAADRPARSRETAPPPESVYRGHLTWSGPKITLRTTDVSVLAAKDPRYSKKFNGSFPGLPKDLGFNNSLSAPQRPSPIDERVPRLAGEWKELAKELGEAMRQDWSSSCPWRSKESETALLPSIEDDDYEILG
ncbi:hypothetical protein B0T16DRAFT_396615 [Cercophora newfieldiana]|uniref:Uncharacterized protein n=1 Tax=Cercophora newfieldiana TaxID=92897 RepID=A0AA40CXQ9_9PEZI|nr:hypothetical protein B0T16DRAFT_396615 [Cercophora newfieldiana]